MSDRNTLRALVRGAYAVQKLRIQIGNRVVANFKTKLGQAPGTPEETLDAEGQNILRDLRAEYMRITDGVARFPRRDTFKGTELISSYTELVLINSYVTTEATEKEHFKRFTPVLWEFPIYGKFLADTRGCGPAMSGVIISEFDITRAQYPSSFWRYAGLDVGPDGRGRSRRKEHLIEVDYTNKEGEVSTKKSITFNPFLKTKLTGVLGPSFLKASSPYAEIYYNYKARLQARQDPPWDEATKLHIHNAANRYMLKMFLLDLHLKWRYVAGLERTKPYHEEKLGIIHRPHMQEDDRPNA